MRSEIISILKITGLSSDEIDKIIEIPQESSRGDYAFPCFVLAKTWKKNPVEIAKELNTKLKNFKGFEKIEAVGPYLNFFIDKKKLALEILKKVEKEKENYGKNNSGKNKIFMIEFSQPNTHKAFHVGHIRGTSLGESLARIKEFSGYKVIRTNYSGDTGMHIAKWLWCYNKFHKGEKIVNEESWFAKIYVEAVQKLEENETGEIEVLEINRKLDESKDKNLINLWTKTRKMSIDSWKPIYHDLGVKFNKHFFESAVEKDGKKIAQELVKKGIAIVDDGATIMNLKPYNLGIWVLLRRDGTVLYSAKDLALAKEKFSKYKINESLVITSVEQNLHFQQLRKTLELMDFDWEKYQHKGYESVRLPEGKMSSRTGNNILYADFRDEVIESVKKEISKRENLSEKESDKRALAIAVASIKYAMLKQDMNKIIIFDKNEALKFEGDTGPYLLYSYARANSILSNVKKNMEKETSEINGSEHNLISLISKFPEIINNSSENMSPSGIAHYAYELAQTFNEFYHSCQVLGSAEEGFRLRLVNSFAQTLGNTLKLLGIPVLKQM